jgi:cation diffusion facilitator family transporter
LSNLTIETTSPALHPSVEENNVRRKRAARASVISNTCLIAAKLGVGLSIGSVSVISEAIHSSVDLIAALMALIAVRAAARPADRSHPYGHGKFENLSGTAESLLIFVGAGVIIYEALHKFGEHGETSGVIWGIAVMGLSAVVNFFVSRYLFKVGRETDSVALLADGAHLQTDVLTSGGVFAGLTLVWLTGIPWLDPLTALVVALLIIKSGWDILLQSVGGLVDASLPSGEEDLIKQTIENYSDRYLNYHELRTRQSGPERHIDFHLVMPNELTVEAAHQLCNNLEEALDRVVNGAIVQIHIEPQSVCTEIDGVYRCSPAHTHHPEMA